MRIFRDFTLVPSGAFVALAIQPTLSISQGSLEQYASNLTAIAKAIKVDRAGGVVIKGNTKVSINAPLVDIGATSQLNLAGGTTKIGKGKLAPAASILSKVNCPPHHPGGAVICSLLPTGNTILIGN